MDFKNEDFLSLIPREYFEVLFILSLAISLLLSVSYPNNELNCVERTGELNDNELSCEMSTSNALCFFFAQCTWCIVLFRLELSFYLGDIIRWFYGWHSHSAKVESSTHSLYLYARRQVRLSLDTDQIHSNRIYVYVLWVLKYPNECKNTP